MALSEEFLLRMYRYMVLGRLFEQRAEQIANRGVVPGSIHLGIGEEATQVGACLVLAPRTTSSPPTAGTSLTSPKEASPSG